MRRILNKLMLIVVTLSMLVSIISSSGAISTVQANGMSSTSLITHTTIRIDNNTDLTTFVASNDCLGSGIANNPYIISGLSINATGNGAGIYIGNTTSHVVIENCTIYNALSLGSLFTNGGGIILNDVSNVAVTNDTCYGCHDGIDIMASNGIIVSHDNCSYNHDNGILIGNHGSDDIITNNACIGCSDGIILDLFNTGDIVSSNNCSGDGNGIYLSVRCNNNEINNNTCKGNSGDGIFLNGSVNNCISNNTCDNNSNGIFLWSQADSNTINFNTLTNNTYGICITYWKNGVTYQYCDLNTIFGNILIANHGSSSVYNSSCCQAFDNGMNYWNSTTYGNYWSDWATSEASYGGMVELPYAIEGGNNTDYYPLAVSSTPYVWITSPASGTVVEIPNIQVTGRANPCYPLEVNGMVVNVLRNGSFSVVVALLNGNNTIKASVYNFKYLSASVEVTYVNLDPLLEQQIQTLDQRLNETRELLNDTNARLNDTNAELNDTNSRLNQTIAANSSPVPFVLSTTGILIGIAALVLVVLIIIRMNKGKPPADGGSEDKK